MISLESRASRPASSLPPSPGEIEEIGQIGMEHAPLEACGIIVVGCGLITLQNYAEDPASNGVMKANDILDGILTLTGSETLPKDLQSRLIFWHTHPGGQQGPSKVDMALRLEQPALRMLVVAIPSGEAVEY